MDDAVKVQPLEDGVEVVATLDGTCMLHIGLGVNLVEVQRKTAQELLEAVESRRPRSVVLEKTIEAAWRLKLSLLERDWWFEAINLYEEESHYMAILNDEKLNSLASQLREYLH